MEEIDIRDLLIYFKSKLFYLFIITFIVVGLGIFYKIMIEKPIYQSSASIILTGFSSSTNDSDSIINTNDLTINSKLITTYQQITKSRKVLKQVIDKLKLDYEVEALASNIQVTGITDTEIIKITVSDLDANLAYEIVNELTKVFSKEVQEIYNVSNVSVLDEPEVAESSSNMSFVKACAIFFVVGVVLSLAVIFIAYYFDTTIKTVEQVENKIDVPVLGSIPDYNQKMKRGKK